MLLRLYGMYSAFQKETDAPADSHSFPESGIQPPVRGNELVKRNTHFVSQKLQYVEAESLLNGQVQANPWYCGDIRQPVGQDVIGNVLSMNSRIDRNAMAAF